MMMRLHPGDHREQRNRREEAMVSEMAVDLNLFRQLGPLCRKFNYFLDVFSDEPQCGILI